MTDHMELIRSELALCKDPEKLKVIINAGCAAAENEYQQATRNAGHVVEGVLVDAVDHTDMKIGRNGNAFAYVKFTGSDDRAGHLYTNRGRQVPMPNKGRAFIIDNSEPGTKGGIYGRHKTPDKRYKGTRGDHFITDKTKGAHVKAKAAADTAMLEAWKTLWSESNDTTEE